MEKYTHHFTASQSARGAKRQALVGVVASGNLEILFERSLAANAVMIEVLTPVKGFSAVWQAVIADFVAQRAVGGLRISINDFGARPDTVMLRLTQGLRLIEGQGS